MKAKKVLVFFLFVFLVAGARGAIFDPTTPPTVPEPPLLAAPINFGYAENGGVLSVFWEWSPDGEIIIGPPIFPPPVEAFSVRQVSSYNFKDSVAVEVAELGNVFRFLGNTTNNRYSYNMASLPTVKFRVRAQRINVSTGKTTYSAYLYSPQITRKVKLANPSISPSGGIIFSTDRIILSNNQQATIKYNWVESESNCSSINNWLTYINPLSIGSKSKLCTYAAKDGAISSDINEAVYTVKSSTSAKQIIFIHTDLLGSPVVETKG